MSKAVSQFEKFDQIVAWLFAQTDTPIKVISTIVDRLARNFRIDTRVGRSDAEQSRTPVLQFINKCDRLAQQLHQVVLRVVRIEGEDTPYELPEKTGAKAGGNQKEKLEHVLQHIVHTLDYIFNYMEDDLALLYLFCDMVAEAEAKRPPPEAAAKRVFFVVERARRVQANLERLQMFVLVKHNGPDPSLVEDLLGLQHLRARGYLTEDEYEFREVEVIENIVRAFVTQGRFLEQKEQHSLVIKREKPIEVPASLPSEQQDAINKLRLLLDESFIDTAEYNARVGQIISRWQEERHRVQERHAQAVKQAALEKKVSEPVEEDRRWDRKSVHLSKEGSPPPVAPFETHHDVEDDGDEPPPPPEFIDEPPPLPQFDLEPTESPDSIMVEASPPPPTALLADDAPDDRWEKPPPAGAKVRINKPLPMPVPAAAEEPAVIAPIPIRQTEPAAGRASSEDAAMAKLAAALEQQAAAKKAAQAQQPISPTPSAAHKSSPSLSHIGARRMSQSASPTDKTPVGVMKADKKRGSLFARMGSSSPTSGMSTTPSTSPLTSSSPSLSQLDPANSASSGFFDDLSALQLTAKKRNDPDAFRLHAVEKKLGMKEVIQMKSCVDKTSVCDGHSLTVKLLVSNQSKKSVNCIKFILQTGADERVVDTVEDATRDVQPVDGDPIFPLIKRAWSGDVVYMLPVGVAPGFYKLRVQLFYNTRYNIETPIGLHVLTTEAMWQKNPLQVFGVPLDEVLRREGGTLPLAVSGPLQALCIDSALDVEGIFRMSGDLTKILAIRDEMDSGKRPNFQMPVRTGGSQGVHVVAGVMKLFLRLLPHPLFTEELYDELLSAHAAVKSAPLADKIVAYKPLVARVPKSARVLFATLADFVNRFVVPHESRNKMSHANLSVIFGPVFVFKANLSPMEELSNASRVNGVVKEFFEAGRELFPEVESLPNIPHDESVKPKETASAAARAPSPPTTLRMGNRRGVMGTGRKMGEGRSSAHTVDDEEENEAIPARTALSTAAPPPVPTSQKPQKPLPPVPRSALTAPSPASSRQLVDVGREEEDEEEKDGSI